jgi:hypothetical protein
LRNPEPMPSHQLEIVVCRSRWQKYPGCELGDYPL